MNGVQIGVLHLVANHKAAGIKSLVRRSRYRMVSLRRSRQSSSDIGSLLEDVRSLLIEGFWNCDLRSIKSDPPAGGRFPTNPAEQPKSL